MQCFMGLSSDCWPKSGTWQMERNLARNHEINIVNLTSDEKKKGFWPLWPIMKNPKDSESLAIDILTFLTGFHHEILTVSCSTKSHSCCVTNSEVRGSDESDWGITGWGKRQISTSIADHIWSFTDYDFAHLLFSDGYCGAVYQSWKTTEHHTGCWLGTPIKKPPWGIYHNGVTIGGNADCH